VTDEATKVGLADNYGIYSTDRPDERGRWLGSRDSAEGMEEIKECKYTGVDKGRKEGRKEFNYIMDGL
jgi:hypothetical protein